MSVHMIQRLASELTDQERDVLKYRLSKTIVMSMARFTPSVDLLRALRDIQPYRANVPSSGLCYLGRPDFISDELIGALRTECIAWRPEARLNGYQIISGVNTRDNHTVAEQLAVSRTTVDWVSRQAGRCKPSFVTN